MHFLWFVFSRIITLFRVFSCFSDFALYLIFLFSSLSIYFSLYRTSFSLYWTFYYPSFFDIFYTYWVFLLYWTFFSRYFISFLFFFKGIVFERTLLSFLLDLFLSLIFYGFFYLRRRLDKPREALIGWSVKMSEFWVILDSF